MRLCAALLVCAAAYAQTPDVRQLVTQAVNQDRRNNEKLRDYTYIQEVVEKERDDNGRVNVKGSKTVEVMILYGQPYSRLIARNGKPLTGDEKAKEDEKLAKLTRERQSETPEARAKRIAEYQKSRERERAFLREIPDAFNMRIIGSESLNGRDNWIVEANPRPGYEPKDRRTQVLPKMKGKFWIDKAETQMVKMEAETIDTVSFGLVVARLSKGSTFKIELTRVNNEIWLPKNMEFQIDARLALLKKFRAEQQITFHDYKKFQTDSRILSTAGTQ